jgi:hypothetical protein
MWAPRSSMAAGRLSKRNPGRCKPRANSGSNVMDPVASLHRITPRRPAPGGPRHVPRRPPPRRRSSPGHPQPSLRSPALCAAPSLPPMPRPGGHVLGRSGLPQAGGGDVASDRCCDRLGAGGAALPGGSPPRGGWRTGLRPHARVKRRSLRRCPHCARGARTRLPLLRVSPLGTAADRSALEVRCLVD